LTRQKSDRPPPKKNNRLLHAMLPQAGGYAAFGGYGKLDDARGLK